MAFSCVNDAKGVFEMYGSGRSAFLYMSAKRSVISKGGWGAIQLEDGDIAVKVLIFQDGEGNYRAFRNHCEHAGRKLDPVPGTETVQCCSIGKSAYDYDGKVLSGSSEKPITQYTVKVENGKLEIQL